MKDLVDDVSFDVAKKHVEGYLVDLIRGSVLSNKGILRKVSALALAIGKRAYATLWRRLQDTKGRRGRMRLRRLFEHFDIGHRP